MIKIEHTSDQELSKDDFIIKGYYTQAVKLFGTKLWGRTSNVVNKITDQSFKNDKGVKGFGK